MSTTPSRGALCRNRIEEAYDEVGHLEFLTETSVVCTFVARGLGPSRRFGSAPRQSWICYRRVGVESEIRDTAHAHQRLLKLVLPQSWQL